MGPYWISWSQKKMLHNQTQISVDFVLAQPFATLMNAKWLNQMEDMDWSVNKQRVGTVRQNKTRCQEIDQARPWPNKISINVRTNLMKQCLLSRTPRSQFNTTDDSNQITRKFQNMVTPVNFSWGRPTVVWGWTDLGHQGSMSVFTRNKCYRILVLPRITFTRA